MRGVAAVEVVEVEQALRGKAVEVLVVAGEHDAQPGAPGLAVGHDDRVRAPQLRDLLATAQPFRDGSADFLQYLRNLIGLDGENQNFCQPDHHEV